MVKEILLLLAGAFIAIIVNYFTQFTSPGLAKKYREWHDQQAQKRASQSVERAKKRIENIEIELKMLRWLTENPVAFNAFAYKALQKLMLQLVFLVSMGILIIIVLDFDNLVSLILLLVYVLIFITTYKEDKFIGYHNVFDNVFRLQFYEKEKLIQIAELQKVVDGEKS